MSTVNNTKMAMNFQAANQRPACNNCAHAEEVMTMRWRCNKGHFNSTALAICAHHQRRQEVKS